MPPRPVILAFDTSAAHCAAALHWGDGQIATRFEPMAKGQGERLMLLLEDLLTQEGFAWSDLDALAVGVGPGNFTGIRIAVSAARGLALGLDIPVIPVSNFEIMRGPNSASDPAPQLVSLPAPQGRNYIQLFEQGKAARDPQIISLSESFGPLDLPEGASVLGQHAADLWYLDAKYDETAAIPSFEREIVDVPETLIRIAAAKWHAGAFDETRPKPLYVKPPDAAPPREPAPVILP